MICCYNCTFLIESSHIEQDHYHLQMCHSHLKINISIIPITIILSHLFSAFSFFFFLLFWLIVSYMTTTYLYSTFPPTLIILKIIGKKIIQSVNLMKKVINTKVFGIQKTWNQLKGNNWEKFNFRFSFSLCIHTYLYIVLYKG